MLTAENYQFAWTLYILAALLGVAIFWHLLGKVRWSEIKIYLCLSLGVLLLTPVAADPEQAFLAPAFLVCALETLFEGVESTARAGIPLLVAQLAMTLVFMILTAAYTLYRRRCERDKQRFQASPEEDQDHAELLQDSENIAGHEKVSV